MHSAIYYPGPRLQRFVHHYELVRADDAFPEPLRPRFYASLVTGLAFFFRLDEPLYFRAPGESSWRAFAPVSVLPPTLAPTENLVYGRFAVLRVIFHPGKLFRLFGLPLNELYTALPLKDWLRDHPLTDLPERLANAKDDLARVNLTEKALLRHLRRESNSPDLMDRLNSLLPYDQPVKPQVQILSDQLGRSVRHLQRQVRQATGMNPYLFLQIRRFCYALDQIHSKKHQHLTDLAFKCHYFDEAHLIREFGRFMGEPPKTYLRRGFQPIVCLPNSAMVGSVIKFPRRS